MKHLCEAERLVIEKLLSDALGQGLLVSVYDGGEWTLTASDSMEALRREIGTTGYTTLKFRKPQVDETGVRPVVGSVFLVHGNGADVISDCSDNPEMLALLKGAEALAGQAA